MRLAIVFFALVACGPLPPTTGTPPTPTPDRYALARLALAAVCAALPPEPQGWRAWLAVGCALAFPPPLPSVTSPASTSAITVQPDAARTRRD